MSDSKWDILKTKELISNRYISLYKDKVRLPDGMIVEDFYRVTVPNSSAIVALTDEMNIVLIRQYRYCYGKELIELPSGVFEDNEYDPLDVARRELLEETGYSSENWTYLGATIENAAKMTNYAHMFMATGCVKKRKQELDVTENIDVVVIPFEEAIAKVMKGEIMCSGPAYAILKAERLMKERNSENQTWHN